MPDTGKIQPLSSPDRTTTSHRLFVRDLVVPCRIGVHPHERGGSQRVRLNLELDMHQPARKIADQIGEVVSYDDIVAGVRAITGHGHINLVETLANRIADMCLADHRVAEVVVRVEKLDVLDDAVSVGVELRRTTHD